MDLMTMPTREVFSPELARLIPDPDISYPTVETIMDDLTEGDGRAARQEIEERILAGLVTF
jgi:hypothetical protein